MVIYDPDGRAIQAYENYLEQQARQDALQARYEDQIDIYNRRTEAHSTNRVRIIIDQQLFKTLYCHNAFHWGSHWEYLDSFRQANGEEIPVDIDRQTLIRFSTLAEEHFTFNPGEVELHLPVRHPRKFEHGEHAFRDGQHMAYIRSNEIEKYIIPWLKKVQRYFRINKSSDQDGRVTVEVPRITIPEDLLEKIHLYGAMLQLGLPKSIQQPLIDALILQMYRKRVESCHLNALEMTVGRFYSTGVAILDPVLNHFIGTYAFRSPEDRNQSGGEPLASKDRSFDEAYGEDIDVGCEPTDFGTTERKILDYAEMNANRIEFPDDTFVLPPQLPVIGHSIRHWSGIRRNGSIVAAHTGFPLNIGMSKKYNLRNTKIPFNENDVEEEDTNRLRSQDHYKRHPPGTEHTVSQSVEEDVEDEGLAETIDQDDKITINDSKDELYDN